MRRLIPVVVVAVLTVVALAYWQRRMVAAVPMPQGILRWSADLYEIYVPVWTFAFRGAHLLPAWNPHQLAGTPILASGIGALLYPPSLLARFLPVHRALGWVCAFHVALAGVFTWLCARALGLSLPAAAVSALAFMLNERFLVERIHPQYLFGAAWVPGVFLGAGRFAARPRPWRGALLGAAVALQFLAGDAQLACYTLYALLLLLPVHLLAGGIDGGYVRRLAAGAGVAGVTAVGLSAVQLLPTLELVGHAVRGFGGLTLGQIVAVPPPPWWIAVLAGGPAVALALLAFVDGRRPAVLVMALLLVGFAALVGFVTPFYTRVFYHLPGVDLFRLPQAILPIGELALALLAGVGLEKAIAGGRTRWPRWIVAGAAGAAVLLVSWRSPLPVVYPLAVLATAVAVALLGSPRARVLAGWGVVGLLLLERWCEPGSVIMMPQNNPAEFFAPPPFVQFLRERVGTGRILVFEDWAHRFPIMPKMGTLYGLDVVQDYEPLTTAAYHAFLAEFEDVNTDRPLFWGRFFPGPSHPGWERLDLLGVRWVVVPPAIRLGPGGLGARFRPAYDAADARIFENTRSLPHAFLVSRAEVVPDPAGALGRIRARDFDPRAVAIVDRAVVWRAAPPDAGTAAVVRVDTAADETLTLHVSTPAPALLVLTDFFWPGWRVAVDGDERRIYRADYLFRGVAVEPGAHEVRFWYAPFSLWAGAAVSVATVVALAGAGVLAWRRRARPGSTIHRPV